MIIYEIIKKEDDKIESLGLYSNIEKAMDELDNKLIKSKKNNNIGAKIIRVDDISYKISLGLSDTYIEIIERIVE